MVEFAENLATVVLLIVTNLKSAIVALESEYLCNQGVDIGGKKADIELYPFVAGLVVKGGDTNGRDMLQCGCTIISTKWIISAAHCVEILREENLNEHDVYISSGNKDWHKGYRHDVLNMATHDKYDDMTKAYDAAVMRVEQPFSRATEKIIALASKYYRYDSNKDVKAVGWGFHESQSNNSWNFHLIQNELEEEVDVVILDQKNCTHLYVKKEAIVTYSQFCAGTAKGGKNACLFDSGGPLFDNFILIGIVSWGIGCGEKDSPGVYTKVSFLEDWIIKVSKELNDPIPTHCLNRGSISNENRQSISGSSTLKDKMQLVAYEVVLIFSYFGSVVTTLQLIKPTIDTSLIQESNKILY